MLFTFKGYSGIKAKGVAAKAKEYCESLWVHVVQLLQKASVFGFAVTIHDGFHDEPLYLLLERPMRFIVLPEMERTSRQTL